MKTVLNALPSHTPRTDDTRGVTCAITMTYKAQVGSRQRTRAQALRRRQGQPTRSHAVQLGSRTAQCRRSYARVWLSVPCGRQTLRRQSSGSAVAAWAHRDWCRQPPTAPLQLQSEHTRTRNRPSVPPGVDSTTHGRGAAFVDHVPSQILAGVRENRTSPRVAGSAADDSVLLITSRQYCAENAGTRVVVTVPAGRTLSLPPVAIM